MVGTLGSRLERLALEINQAGLSWLIVLKRRDALRRAFEGFDVDRVAGYGVRARTRLLADAGIIRNARKIDAVIENAGRIAVLRRDHGSFAHWIAAHHPRSKADWVRLFRETFVFTGGEITGEFLMSIGYLPGAHREDCPVFARIARLGPAWMGKAGRKKPTETVGDGVRGRDQRRKKPGGRQK